MEPDVATLKFIREEIAQAVAAGHIHIKLCGELGCADNLKGFILDKTKYRLCVAEETDTEMRVLIEPRD